MVKSMEVFFANYFTKQLVMVNERSGMTREVSVYLLVHSQDYSIVKKHKKYLCALND